MDKSIQKKTIREDADEEGMRSCDRDEGRICAEKRESVPVVKGRKEGGEGVHKRTVEKGLYLTIKVTTDGAGILCGKEGWKKVDGTRLPISE